MVVPKLSDVCLCAIVRDEMMNPAGGIVDFLDCTVPFVESAVVVDTASRDRTRELLEEAKRKYPNLAVYDHRFKGFANARNYSLKKGRKFSKCALVLDADERLFEKDFEQLAKLEFDSDHRGYNILIEEVDPERYLAPRFHPHNPRIFLNSIFFRYRWDVWEALCDFSFKQVREREDIKKISSVTIKHFIPQSEGIYRKEVELYNPIWGKGPFQNLQPSACPSFNSWKQLNPRRARYK